MSGSLIKCLLLAVVLSFYTYYGAKWWLKCEPKISNWWIKIPLSLLVVLAIIFVPLCLLGSGSAWHNFTEHQRTITLLIWILPGFLLLGYAAIKNRKKTSGTDETNQIDPGASPDDP
jgi:hypothetical protein